MFRSPGGKCVRKAPVTRGARATCPRKSGDLRGSACRHGLCCWIGLALGGSGECMTPGSKRLPEISVVLAVRNSEDVIGSGTRRVVDHLRELSLAFEVVGVNAGSWDTSFQVLRLLAAQVPELRLIEKDMTGR